MPNAADLAYTTRSLIENFNLIKTSVDKLPHYATRYEASIKTVLGNLDRIKKANDEQYEGLDVNGLCIALATLESNTERLRQRLEDTSGLKRDKSAPKRLVSARSVKNKREDILGSLGRLDKEIAQLAENYLSGLRPPTYVPAGSRAELIAGVHQIKRQVEHHVKLALYDPSKIRRLLRLAGMTAPEMIEAVQETAKIRRNGNLSDLEKLYLMKKESILRVEVRTLTGQDSPSSSDSSPNNSQEGFSDPILETFRIIRSLLNQSSQADLRSTGADFDALQVALTSLDMREEVIMTMKLEVGIHRELSSDEPEPELAGALHRLAGKLVESGRKQEALPYMHEAVGVHKRLSRSMPGPSRDSMVAQSLQGLSECLISLGRQREALQYVREAEDIFRRVSPPETPNAGPAEMTQETALQRARDAVETRRQFAEDRPKEFLPHLVSSLIRYSRLLRDTGQWEEAFQQVEEAVHIGRGLISNGDEDSIPPLANSLSNLSSISGVLGLHTEALEYITEAVLLQRRLVEDDPDRYRVSLAHGLQSQGRRLMAVGSHRAGAKSFQEAVRLWQAIAGSGSPTIRPELASCLTDLSTSLLKLGKSANAAKCVFESTRMLQTLAEQNPDKYSTPLAIASDQLATCLGELGQEQDAMRYQRNAVGILRKLVRQQPGSLRPDLARAVGNLAAYLARIREYQEALQLMREAVAIWRELALENAEVSEPFLARALHGLASYCIQAWNPERAARAATEAVNVFRRLAREHPELYDSELGTSLHTLAQCLVDTDQLQEGLRCSREAVSIRKALADTKHRDACDTNLASSLSDLAAYLKEARRDDEAVDVLGQAVEVQRRRALARPQAVQDLAGCLYNLGACLGDTGRYPEALEATEEAVTLYRAQDARDPGNLRCVRLLRECMEQATDFREALGLETEVDRLHSITEMPEHS